ncbi:MAG TPA: hypothetical protein DCX14_16220 [Flavobacteriales bacterium]|nr:hypothetical protein [Flavobacteriales bacterium]
MNFRVNHLYVLLLIFLSFSCRKDDIDPFPLLNEGPDDTSSQHINTCPIESRLIFYVDDESNKLLFASEDLMPELEYTFGYEIGKKGDTSVIRFKHLIKPGPIALTALGHATGEIDLVRFERKIHPIQIIINREPAHGTLDLIDYTIELGNHKWIVE